MLRQPYVLSIYPPGGPLDGNTTVAVRGRGLAAVRFVKFGDERGEVLHRGLCNKSMVGSMFILRSRTCS